MKKKIVVGGIVVAIASSGCHNSAKGAEKECPCGRGQQFRLWMCRHQKQEPLSSFP